jgi:hypothetical protein
MSSPSPSKKVLSDLKASILNPALTSHFQCWFIFPSDVQVWIKSKASAGLGVVYDGNEDFISLSCAEASLPGSSLATHEINNDHTGVTERHAYRRQYDATTAFTFYVDHDYDIIYFFENWMSFIVNEQIANGLNNSNYSYRVNFPKDYQTELYINKFERDYRGKYLEYRFLNAYPISIDSMPVSYETSQLLKCTVTFNYSRYVVGGKYLETINQDQTEFQNSIDRGVRLGDIPGTRTIGQTGAGTFAELNQINGDIG